MEIHIAFGRTLRKWRRARLLSQADLASACGLDRTFISLLERGGRQPSLSTVFVLSKALRVTPGELVRQTEQLCKSPSARHQGNAPSRRL